jgi:hypothetical protein
VLTHNTGPPNHAQPGCRQGLLLGRWLQSQQVQQRAEQAVTFEIVAHIATVYQLSDVGQMNCTLYKALQ